MTKRDIIQKEKAQEIINSGYNGIAHLCPRFGKCRVVLNYLIKSTDKVVIGYPELNIKNSWEKEIEELKFNGKNIKFTTYKSFSKLKSKYDVLILDEIHQLSPQQTIDVKKFINFWEIKKVIGLSGSISEKTALELNEGLDLKIVSFYTIEQAVEDGIVKDYQINIVKIPLSRKRNLEVKTKTSQFYTSEKEKFDWYTREIAMTMDSIPRNYTKLKIIRLQRMNLIKNSQAKVDLVKGMLWKWKNERVLIFTGLTKIADTLGCASYHSNSKSEINRDLFMTSKINHLAVVNKLSSGVTFTNLNKAIIGFFDSNEENLFQKISRSLVCEYNNKAEIYIITSDEEAELKWLNSALKFFSERKIKYLNIEEL